MNANVLQSDKNLQTKIHEEAKQWLLELASSEMEVVIKALRGLNTVGYIGEAGSSHDGLSIIGTLGVQPLVELLKKSTDDAVILKLLVPLLWNLSIYEGVKMMLHGIIPPLLKILGSDLEGASFSALGALATLAFIKTVRDLIWQLLSKESGVQLLVERVNSKNYSVAFHATQAVSFISLNETSLATLSSYNSLAFIKEFCNRDPFEEAAGAVFYLTVNELEYYAALLTSPHSELLCFFAFVFARFSSTNPIVNGAKDLVIPYIRTTFLPQIRFLATSSDPRTSELALLALNNLNDTLFKRNIDEWINSLNISNPNTVIKTLKKNEIDMNLLLNTNLSIDNIRDSLRELKFKEGEQLRMLASLKEIRLYLEKAKEQTFKLVELAENKIQHGEDTGLQSSSSQLNLLPVSSVDVFISYSWANKQAVKRLRDVLAKNGLTVWMDEGNMKGGQQLFSEIDKGVSEAAVFMACVSNQYAASENCRREINLATERKKLIVPVWIAPLDPWPPRGEMGPLLAGKLYIDLSTEERLKSTDQLVAALKQSL